MIAYGNFKAVPYLYGDVKVTCRMFQGHTSLFYVHGMTRGRIDSIPGRQPIAGCYGSEQQDESQLEEAEICTYQGR